MLENAYSYFIIFTLVALLLNLVFRILSRKRDNALTAVAVIGLLLIVIATIATAVIYFNGKQALAFEIMYAVIGGVGGYVFFIANSLIEQIFSRKK